MAFKVEKNNGPGFGTPAFLLGDGGPTDSVDGLSFGTGGGAALIATASFDPANKNASVTLSEANKRMTGTGTGQAVKSTSSKLTGDYYFEVQCVSLLGGVGLCNASQSLSTWMGNTTNSIAIDASSGQVYNNGISVFDPGQGALTAGKIACVAWSTSTLKMWFGIDGNYGSGNNPATRTGGYDYSARSSLIGTALFMGVAAENNGSSFRIMTPAFAPAGFTLFS